jgi:hypothetical protein
MLAAVAIAGSRAYVVNRAGVAEVALGTGTVRRGRPRALRTRTTRLLPARVPAVP